MNPPVSGIVTSHYVSVIIPVYNRPRQIATCIEHLLKQDYPKDRYEIIIVDNTSTDNTADVIKSFPVRYAFEGSIQTSYAARNKGIEEAKGDILAFTDSDCYADPGWLREGVKPFANPEVGLVAGPVLALAPTTRAERYLVAIGLFKHSGSRHPFLTIAGTGNVFYRKVIFEMVGKFESYWPFHGDADMAWRTQLLGKKRVAYAPLAQVTHEHRATTRGVIWQAYEQGFGQGLRYWRYRYMPEPERIMACYVRPLWYIAKMIVKGIIAPFTPRLNVYDAWVGVCRETAMIAGRFHGRRLAQKLKVSILWNKPLPGGKPNQ